MKVLLIVDFINWAWGIKATALKKNLPQYDIDICTIRDLQRTNLKKYNSIHSFSWTDTGLGDIRNRTTCGISSHAFLFRCKEAKEKIPNFSAVGVTSKKLYNLIREIGLCSNIYNTSNGVDHNFFSPSINNKENKKFVIGWVGKKTIGGFENIPIDFKGYCSVLLPLKEKLKDIKDIELRIIDKNPTNCLDRTQMRDFYRSLDLFICTSYREGTPNPVFEASACGVPVLSTDVGCVPELIINNHNGIIIPSYDNLEDINNKYIIDKLYENIIYLKDNRDVIKTMGNNNREIIEINWTWKNKANQWIPLFEDYKL